MAERRMFAKKVVESDRFLDMPLSTQALYFHLGMHADDDGFVSNPKTIKRSVNASDNDLELLFNKGFIKVFESGVILITHWKLNNFIRSDRYTPTIYTVEKSSIGQLPSGEFEFKSEIPLLDVVIEDEDNNDVGIPPGIPDGIPGGNQVVYPGKERLVEVREDEVSEDKGSEEKTQKKRANARVSKPFIPPTYEECKQYYEENHAKHPIGDKKRFDFDLDFFYDFFTAGDWHDSEGKQVKNWKQKMITWTGGRKGKQNNNNPSQPKITGFMENTDTREWIL